jgi:hypothetical protein
LKELPKTLDEKYERILTSMPFETRDYAIRALHLLCANVWTSIPTIEILADAVSYDGSRESIDHQNNLLGIKSLQEICTCFISVSEVQKTDDLACNGHGVVLAHYTVKEFLFSERIVTGPVSDFHTSAEATTRVFYTMMFSYLLDYYSCLPLGSPTLSPQDHFFYKFCMQIWHYEISNNDIFKDDPILFNLILRFLHPSEPHWNCFFAENWIQMDAEAFYRRASLFRGMAQASSSSTAVLVNFMHLQFGTIAERFMDQCEDLETAFTTFFTIDASLGLEGFLLDICAFFHEFKCMEIFRNRGAVRFDKQRVLFHAMRRDLDEFRDQNSFQTLNDTIVVALNIGATPNPPGFRFTPLQFAIFDYQRNVIETLLDQGALPNACGDPFGEIPAGIEIFEDYASQRASDQQTATKAKLDFPAKFCTASPLYICRHMYDGANMKYWDKKLLENIEALLLGNGARELFNGVQVSGNVDDNEHRLDILEEDFRDNVK